MAGTDLIRRANLAQVCEARERTLDFWRRGAELIHKGNMMAGRAGGRCCSQDALRHLSFCTEVRDVQRFAEQAAMDLDREVWRCIIETCGLADVMSANDLRKFRESVEGRDVPAATFDSASATLASMVAKAPESFRLGVVDLFADLSREYRTNRAFDLPEKFILDHAVSRSDWRHGDGRLSTTVSWEYGTYRTARDRINDLERTLCVLDGRRPPEHPNKVTDTMDQEVLNREGRTHETELLRFKWFLKGTMHVWIKREDLREQINRIIAKHYGEVLADAS